MKTLKYYLNKAYQQNWAIGQFNFSDFSQVKGIIQAARDLRSPIILGTSEGESRFLGLEESVAIRDVLRRKTKLPIFLNLDHGKSFEYLKEAVMAGYDMVCFDGSKLELNENIKISKKVANFAKKRGVLIEGEVGRFGTDASRVYQEKFKIKEEDLTNPLEAMKYMNKTKVDILAISIGTFHGIDSSGASPHIRLDRLKQIKDSVNVPLVLHGGSGTPESDMKEAIKMGIVKININTESRVAFSNTLRKSLEANRDEITPYKYLLESISAVKTVVEEKIRLFGSENKA